MLAVGTDDQFARLCAEAGLPDLAADPRFRRNPDRVVHREALVAALAEAIAARPLAAWLDVLRRAGVPGGAVRTIPEVFEAAPFAVVALPHPTLGEVRGVRGPIAVDGADQTSAVAPPLLGQHTRDVLAELGYAPGEVDALAAGACAYHGVGRSHGRPYLDHGGGSPPTPRGYRGAR